MSGPVQAGTYPSLGLLRLHHLHVVEVLPGKKRMTLQEVREREMMKEAAMQKDPNFGMQRMNFCLLQQTICFSEVMIFLPGFCKL